MFANLPKIIILSLVLAVTAAAQQSMFPPSLDLGKAVDAALEKNPQAKMAAAGERVAAAAISEAKVARKPFVQVEHNVVRSNNPVFVFGSLLEQGRFKNSNFSLGALNAPDGMFNLRSALTFRQPLLDQKQTFSRVKLAENAKSQAELGSEAVRQQLRFEVVRSFYGALLAKEMLKVTDEALKAAEANCKKTKDMVEVGMTTDADYLAADVEYAGVAQQKLEAESNLATTLAALNIAMGETPDKEFELRGELVEKFFPAEDQPALIRVALENRADYKRALLDAESGRERLRAEQNKRLPQAAAFGSFGYSSPYIANGSTDYTVGLSLTYTLFDAGRKAREEQVAANLSVAELAAEDLAAKIRLEVVRAANQFTTAKSRIGVTVKAIAQSEEALRIIQDRYKFGLTTFNEVLRAEATVLRAKHDLLSARYQYLVGYAALLLATGRLTDARVLE